MKVLIIEDEKAAARNLSSLLAGINPNIVIIKVLDNVMESIDWLTHNPQPELIFMDIHLADGSAFDIFERCQVNSPIIFTTAYDEYAIKAFKVNSIDYLLKPIDEIDLRKSIEKFNKTASVTDNISKESINLLINSLKGKKWTTHLLIPMKGNKMIPLFIGDIAHFRIEEGFVRAKTHDLRVFTVPHTLEQLYDMIDSSIFFRVNRQYIVSKNDIAHIELWFGGRLSIKLKSSPDAKIIINKPRVADFKVWLTGCGD